MDITDKNLCECLIKKYFKTAGAYEKNGFFVIHLAFVTTKREMSSKESI